MSQLLVNNKTSQTIWHCVLSILLGRKRGTKLLSSVYFVLPSLVGASLIIVGLYCVLWAKRTENLVIGQPDDEKGFDDDKMQEISINEIEMNSVTNETK